MCIASISACGWASEVAAGFPAEMQTKRRDVERGPRDVEQVRDVLEPRGSGVLKNFERVIGAAVNRCSRKRLGSACTEEG